MQSLDLSHHSNARSFAAQAQVGTADARLPVKRGETRPDQRAVRHLARMWVLHQRVLSMLMVFILVGALIAGAFASRGGIMAAGTYVGHILSGRFAAVGMGVNQIVISGQALTSEKKIAQALAIRPETTIFEFDPSVARQRLLELPAVADAQVGKVYPSTLIVEIDEVVPVALWRLDGLTYFVDGQGNQLGVADPADTGLPVVIGDGAADDAAVIVAMMAKYPEFQEGLAAYSRIADRRWDVIYENGLRIKLPEKGIAQALLTLQQLNNEHQIMARDLQIIDLRADHLVALTVNPSAEEES